jgi:hypothetical protein
MDEESLGTIVGKRDWLWKNDFRSFRTAVRSAPVYDAVALTFAEIHDRAKLMDNDVGVTLAVAMFYVDPVSTVMRSDEVMRAVYVWSARDMAAVAAMKRQELRVAYQAVRKTVSWKPRVGDRITIMIDELDVAERKLHLLLALYERKRERSFMTPQAIAQDRNYNAVGPLILRIYCPGGVAVPGRSAIEEADVDEVAEVEVPEVGSNILPQVPEVGSSILPQPKAGVPDLEEAGDQDLVVDVRDSDSEKLSTDSDDPEGLQAEAHVEAWRVAKAARLSQIQNDISDPNLSLAQLADITKKELETDKAEEETRQRGELDVAKPVDEMDNDLRGDETRHDNDPMIDRISSHLRAKALWNKVSMEHIDVDTDWSMCNVPNSEGLILCPHHLVDARVFDVKTWRNFVEEAYAVTRLFERDAANKAMPPHCELIGSLAI